MSGSGLHLNVQMADASTSTVEDGEIDFVGIGMSGSPTATFNNYCEALCEQEIQPGGCGVRRRGLVHASWHHRETQDGLSLVQWHLVGDEGEN